VRDGFGAQDRGQKGAGETLGTEIAKGGFWRAFVGSFKREGCAYNNATVILK